MSFKIIFVTGGCRSGKSNYALEATAPYRQKAFIATAEVTDAEMQQRIDRHKLDRGADFKTIEEPLDLAKAMRNIPQGTQIAIIDCLTVWIGNLMHHQSQSQTTKKTDPTLSADPALSTDAELSTDPESYPQIGAFLGALKNPPCNLVIVSNELGMGLVPAYKLGRQFRDLAGLVNQKVAKLADNVVFTVSGIPLTIKGDTNV